MYTYYKAEKTAKAAHQQALKSESTDAERKQFVEARNQLADHYRKRVG